ncbi:MAG: glycoside hydrolase family 3 protein, partial [Lachnospiraceae bacterium]|nr:glycoside hydrolase family 3 protein [Lachnospiraceae bacterium]
MKKLMIAVAVTLAVLAAVTGVTAVGLIIRSGQGRDADNIWDEQTGNDLDQGHNPDGTGPDGGSGEGSDETNEGQGNGDLSDPENAAPGGDEYVLPPETPLASMSEEGINAYAKYLLSKMTLQQKLTQMMIVTLRSDPDNTYLTDGFNEEYEAIFKKYGFGGVLLYLGNIDNIPQTVKMTDRIQKAALASELSIPMFVSVDQEGGYVNRVIYGSVTPGNMAIAATGDLKNAELCAGIIGKEIKALGFNVDFAPVCDVNNNPNNTIIGVRSFSDDPQMTADYVGVFVEGLREQGLLTALKHFPGHGNVAQDSHTGLPMSGLDMAGLKECELIPFREGIDRGADMIMTAHIQYPEIEKKTYISKQDGKEVYLPATLSHKILTELLRDEMGFEGIIITDAIDMDAIENHFDRVDATQMAINAGADIILCAMNLYKGDRVNTFPTEEEYLQKLVERAEIGAIDPQRIDESVMRILKLKIKRGIMDIKPIADPDEHVEKAMGEIATEEHQKTQWDIAQQAVTLMKNDGVLPLDGGSGENILLLYPEEKRKATYECCISRLRGKRLLTDSHIVFYNYEKLNADDEAFRQEMESADVIIIVSQMAVRNKELARAMDSAREAGKKTVLMCINLPYDAACYGNVNAAMCCYL